MRSIYKAAVAVVIGILFCSGGFLTEIKKEVPADLGSGQLTWADGQKSLAGQDMKTKDFENPPASFRPQTFWHWMNGNVTREGITADLEAMAKTGIGGVFLFIVEGQVTESVPVYIEKPVRHLTPEWVEMLRHAASECKRLGLKLSLMNCIGWSASGGTWVTPDKSMMRITWSEKYANGPGKIAGTLPLPPCDYSNYQNLTAIRSQIHESVPPEQRFYKDIAVLAYKMDSLASRTASLWPPRLSCTRKDGNLAFAVDGDGNTSVSVNGMGFLQFDFDENVTVRGLDYLGDACELQTLEKNGTNWMKITDLPASPSGYPQLLPVKEIQGKSFRLFFKNDGSVKDARLTGESLVQDYRQKASFHSAWEDSKTAQDRIGSPTPGWASAVINSKDVLNITNHLKPDGSLDWEVPKGSWMIVRLGYAPIGKLNGPSSREFVGLECNKLDSGAVQYHFDKYAGFAAGKLKDLIGTGFHAVHFDSWEAGDLNYTPAFIEEFRKRRGYDPTPFLLVHGSGRIVDSPEVSDRFLWDVRRTIADLLADNYFGKMTELCHDRGLKFQGEIAGVMVQTTVDQLQAKGRCDLPMGEFQMPNWLYGDHWARWDSKEASSGAHIHNKSIVGAEAFTGFDRWLTDPYALKGIGDLAFTMGINQLVFHTWALDPWKDREPGMTMGPFGVNFSRKNTWWGRPAKVYLDYLRRCQYMLQQGQYVADILYFYGEGAPNTLPSKSYIKPELPEGYSYDGCDAGILLSKDVVFEGGRLKLPGGMNYHVLVLKDDNCMTPELLQKVANLVRNGLTVIGPKPLKSPSLKNYPECDQEVRKLANEVWGDINGIDITMHQFGAGRVIWGPSVKEALKSLNISPDVEIMRNDHENSIEWIHRKTNEADIYFVSNQQNIIEHGSSNEIWEMRYDSYDRISSKKDEAKIDLSFRITGKQPALWDAVSGKCRSLPEFREENGRTTIPVSLASSGSCFIVFRHGITGQPGLPTGKKNFPALKTVAEINGSWTVDFDPKWGGPGQVTFDVLEDWTANDEPGVKYYSGRATYKKIFNAGQEVLKQGEKIYLDLGRLRSLAEVRLNGKDLGVLWCPPWRVEVTGLLKPENNMLEVDIINVWANRLIGDAALPEKERVTWTSLTDTRWALKPDDKLIPSGLYGPVTLCIE